MRRAKALLCLSVAAMLVAAPQASAAKVAGSAASALDLSSSSRARLPVGLIGSRTVSIQEGGTIASFNRFSLATPAERLAIWQIVSAHRQTIQLNALGTATGGYFSLGKNFTSAFGLTIPQGVTAIADLSRLPFLAIHGTLINEGNLLVVDSHLPEGGAVHLNALSIFNGPTGTISDIGAGGNELSLHLHASGLIINQGNIFSGGKLQLQSGGNLSPRSAAIEITGGSLNGRSISLNAPSGRLIVEPQTINGALSLSGRDAVVAVNSGQLQLARLQLSGDPLLINSAGSITLPKTIGSNGGPISVIAAGDIDGAAGTGTTVTSAGGAVIMLAGAQSTTVSGVTTVNGASGLKGDIKGINSISTSARRGGSVIVGSFDGLVSIGNVLLGSGSGSSGRLQAMSAQGITTGDITAHGGHGSSANATVQMLSASPDLGSGLTFSSTGQLLSGSIQASSKLGTGSIVAGNIDAGNEARNGTNGGTIVIASGGTVTTGYLRSTGSGAGGGAPAAEGYDFGGNGMPGGSISITANGAVVINGDINTSGGGGGGSNIGAGGNGGNGGDISINTTGPITVTGPILAPGGGGGGGSGICSCDTAGGGGSLGNGAGPDSGGLFINVPPYNGIGFLDRGPVFGNPNNPRYPYPGMGGSNTAYDYGCCGAGYGGNVGDFGGNGGTGTFQLGYWDDEQPHAGGRPGIGGNITITGTDITVKGTVGSFYGAVNKANLSPYAGLSIFTHSQSGGGILTINTNGGAVTSQIYASNGDLTDTNASVTAALRGSRLLLAGSAGGNNINLNGSTVGTKLAAGTYVRSGNISMNITEEGASRSISNGEIVTPSEWVALIQVSAGNQTLVLNANGQSTGGSLSLAPGNVPFGGFSSLVIPTSVTAHVSAPAVAISGTADIAGRLDYQGALALTAGALQVEANGSISPGATGSTLSINTSSLTLGNNSSIAAGGRLSLAAPGQLSLTLADGAVSSLVAAGGNVNINASGAPLVFSKTAGSNTAALNVLGAPLIVTSSSLSVAPNLTVKSDSSIAFSVSNGFMNSGTISSSPAAAPGTITISSTGNLDLTAGLLLTAQNAGASNGGTVRISANGTLTVETGTIDTSAVSNGNGGTIYMSAAAIAASGGAFQLTANAAGAGNGGSITISSTASSLNIGSTTNPITVSAKGGSAGGNGGAIKLLAAGDLAISMSGVSAAPLGTSGNGATLDFEAGTVLAGQLSITGDVHADAAPSGSGGTVVLHSNSSNVAFAIGQPTTNGVSGIVTANAGATGGNGGSLTVSSGQGSIMLAQGQYSFDGSGSFGNGGHIELSGSALTVSGPGTVLLHASGAGTGDGGSIELASAGDLAIGQAGGNFSLTACSGASGGNGGRLAISSGGVIALDTSGLAMAPLGTKGNGGSLSITASQLTEAGNTAGNAVNLIASGVGTGNGGTVSVTLSGGSPVYIGNAPGQLELRAAGGVDGGNGGSVSVSTSADLFVAPAAISIAPQATNGNGGSLSLSAHSISGQNLSEPLILSAAAAGTGNGGTVIVESFTNVTVGKDNGSIQLIATGGPSGGNGGNVSVSSSATLSLDTSALQFSPLSQNGNGGGVSLAGDHITWANMGSQPLLLSADGQGTGNGGFVAVTISGTQPSTIGKQAGDFELSAQSGLSGNGGMVSFHCTGDLQATATALNVAPHGTNANGGVISLIAANLFVQGHLSANAKGNGTAGAVSLSANSGTPFTIGSATNNGTTSGIKLSGNSGILSIEGQLLAGGSISLTNASGDVVVVKALSAPDSIEINAADAISFSASIGTKQTQSLKLSANSGSITGIGHASLTGTTLSALANGGSLGSQQQPLRIKSAQVIAAGSDSVYIYDGNRQSTTIDGNSGTPPVSAAGDSFVFTTAGALHVVGDLQAGNLIALQTGGRSANLTLDGSLATTETDSSIKLVTASSGGIFASSLSTITSTRLALTAGKAGIGQATQPITSAAHFLSIKSAGAVSLQNLKGAPASKGGDQGLTVTVSQTANSFSLLDSTGALTVAGSLAAGNPRAVESSSNSVGLIETSGSININGNITVYGGSLLIQNQDGYAGSISFAPSVQVKTLVSRSTDGANGAINIAVGPVPALPSNPGQSNFSTTVQTVSSGNAQVFAGANPGSIIGPPTGAAAVDAAGRNIIFNSATAGGIINLGSNVLIKADPPAFRQRSHLSPVAYVLASGGAAQTVLLTPSQNLSITTRFGTVHLAAGCAVILSAGNEAIAVFDLHDERQGDVMVHTNEGLFELTPGRHLTISGDRSVSFNDLNAASAVGYRQVSRQQTGSRLSVFTAEFSIPTAVSAFGIRQRLSQQTGQGALLQRILKDGAILMRDGASAQPYHFYRSVDVMPIEIPGLRHDAPTSG